MMVTIGAAPAAACKTGVVPLAAGQQVWGDDSGCDSLLHGLFFAASSSNGCLQDRDSASDRDALGIACPTS
ncbi:hypothetical protein PR002_g20562 [Phytophthora rubi]|uniref:Uncharacterized protein n=1 Tax=Phytophthora rubi TaxID=129364 RepID=A0A6A3JCG5_9STRA|nr:hypothetical protein PR002_g20562 [Phytophthora rubi]